MLITVEGIEGSGKTTQIAAIADLLRRSGREVILTREPGGTRIGARIREILLDPESRDLVPAAELMLYAADRAQHLEAVIRPALAAGKAVVSDRFCDATMVYQGVARGLDRKFIEALHRWLLQGLAPNVTFLLDLAPEIGLARAWRRIESNGTAGESRFESESLAFHRRIREGYLEIARQEPQRFRIVDASQTPASVTGQITRELERLLQRP